MYRCYKQCHKFQEPCLKEYCTEEELFPKGSFFPCNPENEFFCLVVGSRSLCDYQIMEEYLDKMLEPKKNKDIIIVSGGASSGADRYAEKYAAEHDYPLIVFPADWEGSGKKAGYERNRRMHEYIAKQKDRGCVMFWDGISPGTYQSFALGQEFGNPIRLCKFAK